MKYRVRCELFSHRPELACSCPPVPLRSRDFDHPQEAANYARAFVRDFDGSEIPDKLRKWYGADDLPRATVERVGGKRNTARIAFHIAKLPSGEVKEFRTDVNGKAKP